MSTPEKPIIQWLEEDSPWAKKSQRAITAEPGGAASAAAHLQAAALAMLCDCVALQQDQIDELRNDIRELKSAVRWLESE